MVIITDIPVKRMASGVEKYMGKYVRVGSATARARCGGVDPWDFFLWPQYRVTYSLQLQQHKP
jgi:hypothetical protein